MDTLTASTGPGAEVYGSTIFEYAQVGGRFVVLSNDAGFVELLKNVLFDTVGVPKASFFQLTYVEDLFVQLRREPANRHIILLERMVLETNLSQVMESIVRICHDARVIVVTREVDQYTTALLVEQGAHNIITKPISIASIIEKLAFAIAPQGRLSRLIEQGKKLLEVGNWGEALLIADKILMQKPDSAVGYMIMGDAYRGLDMPSRAEDMYLRASQSVDLYLAPLKRLAGLYADSGDRAKQLQYLRRLNEISPLNTQRVLEIGELEMLSGNMSVAREMFDQAVSLAKREAAAMISSLSSRIADVCMDHDVDLAIEYARQALELKGGNYLVGDLKTLNILGISLRKQGRWQEAVSEYKRAAKSLPDNAALLYNMALAYSDGGRTDIAAKLVQRALELEPELPDSGSNVAFNIGTILEKAGLDGQVYFKKAYAQNPDDNQLLLFLRQRHSRKKESNSQKTPSA